MGKEMSEKLFFEFIDKRETYLSKNTFFEPENFEWTNSIETQYQLINNELISFYTTHKNDFHPYFVNELVNESGKWRSFGFYFWGMRADTRICSYFRETITLLKTIPNLVSASISVMEPNSEIKPHYGDTNAIYRCHLGLKIPGKLPEIGFQVGYEKRSWEEGRFLIFNDAAYHKAWNSSEQSRIILILDVIRPEFEHKKLGICVRVQSIILSQHLIKHYPKIRRIIKFCTIQLIIRFYIWCSLKTFKRKSLWL